MVVQSLTCLLAGKHLYKMGELVAQGIIHIITRIYPTINIWVSTVLCLGRRPGLWRIGDGSHTEIELCQQHGAIKMHM